MTTTHEHRLTGYRKGFGNSALQIPYVLGVLDCDHLVEVETAPRPYACPGCGKQTTDISGACSCGYKGGYKVLKHDIHDDANIVMKIGTVVECDRCRKIEEDIARIPDLVARSVHSRWRDGCSGEGYITFYGRDTKSPTGVIAIGGVRGAQVCFDAIRAARGSGPLSPTEGL